MALGAIGAGINVLGGLLGRNAERKAAKMADARIREGVDYAQNRSGQATTYSPLGADAARIEAGLLGIGDSADADEAFRRYQGSTGYRTRLQEGTDAITGSAAAGGSLLSGATLKGLNRFGQGLASQEFINYLNQLQNPIGRGFNADSQILSATTGGASGAASALQQGYSRGNAIFQQGLGDAAETFYGFQGAGTPDTDAPRTPGALQRGYNWLFGSRG